MVRVALDREAEDRATSVYFPGRVIPMLPEALSNGLCSLKPEVDRLAMVCEMELSAAGKLTRYHFYEAVIHSHARLTYTQVGQVLETGSDPGVDKRLVPDLKRLHSLYGVLRAARDKRGAIDFETVETRIIFDQQRKIESIVPVVRNDAHKLIEEAMITANVCAAEFIEKSFGPKMGIYRVHEPPAAEKLEQLKHALAGHTLASAGLGEGAAELALEQTIDSAELLLLAELDGIIGLLPPARLSRPVGPGRIRPTLDGALLGVALGALEEEFLRLAAAELANWSSVTSHPYDTLLNATLFGRPTAVMRQRRHIHDRPDGQSGAGEGLNGRFPAGPRSLHPHVDPLHPHGHGLPAHRLIDRRVGNDRLGELLTRHGLEQIIDCALLHAAHRRAHVLRLHDSQTAPHALEA